MWNQQVCYFHRGIQLEVIIFQVPGAVSYKLSNLAPNPDSSYSMSIKTELGCTKSFAGDSQFYVANAASDVTDLATISATESCLMIIETFPSLLNKQGAVGR